ncbi:MAG TPA: hypothetical protein VFU31_05040, partial [Candidatus Binatia bacterium]|nr:hypothetical protein [Candidatus Binatia bacterium]
MHIVVALIVVAVAVRFVYAVLDATKRPKCHRRTNDKYTADDSQWLPDLIFENYRLFGRHERTGRPFKNTL